MPIDACRIALAGIGSVGQALLESLIQDPIPATRIVALADSQATLIDLDGLDAAPLLSQKRASGQLPGDRFEPFEGLVQNGEVDIVVDCTPTDLETGHPSLGLHELCADHGVHLVTANKGPLAVAGPELRARFAKGGAVLRGEATVGGGLPVLSTLERLAQADRIASVKAIANASTTGVLKRIEQGIPLAQAIEEAKQRGILESDPSLDLTGQDAAAKAAILAQTCFGAETTISDVPTEGILSLDAEQIAWHRERGYRVRLVASVTQERTTVAPVPLPSEHPLASCDAGNAYVIELEHGGRVTLTGPGAGPAETATAVRRDVVGVLAHRAREPVRASASPRTPR